MTKTFVRGLLAASIAVTSLVSAPAFATYDGLNRHMVIDNQTDGNVEQMFISNSGSGRWGPDQLGDDVLHAHRYTVYNVDDNSGYCRFDFKFVMDDGTTHTSYDVNVCQKDEIDVVE